MALTWDLATQFGFTGPKTSSFYDPMGREFWAGLSVLEEAKFVVAELEKRFGGLIAILTAPVLTPGCPDGKRDWVQKHFPKYLNRTFVGGAKYIVGHPSALLVDDSPKNIMHYEEVGPTCLVPRPWNENRHLLDARGRFTREVFVDLLEKAIRDGEARSYPE